MKFYLDTMILWLKDGSKRELKFEKNKINVITGNSRTGKTSIMQILDYCLCGNEAEISDERIGKHVLWYGIRFRINNKLMTIARGERINNSNSKKYYFNNNGNIPERDPVVNTTEDTVKKTLLHEFSLDHELAVFPARRSTDIGTQISYRYFLVFNRVFDVITSSKRYFDKLDEERYKKAWPYIFDLAFDVINLEILKNKRYEAELKREISELKKTQREIQKRKENREITNQSIIKMAKEAHLIDGDLSGEGAFAAIEKALLPDTRINAVQPYDDTEYNKLISEYELHNKSLLRLKAFTESYDRYKKNLKNEKDSLRPIQYILQQFSENTSGEYREFLDLLQEQFRQIKKGTLQEASV